MWQLADLVSELDRTLRTANPVDGRRRADTIRLLMRMENVIGQLPSDPRTTNHPLLREHLGDFQNDVVQARRAIEVDPPSYFLAGVVSGSCLSCHASGAR
jgi:hypothetical protein